MNFRPTAQLREMHDDMRCPPECPLCARIEAYDPPERVGARDYLTTNDYEDPQ